VGVPFEFAVVLGVVVLGVGVALLGGAFGACGVFCGLLDDFTMCIAYVSRNAGDFTVTDKPAWQTCVSRWRQRE
jgi:hypothetical protein